MRKVTAGEETVIFYVYNGIPVQHMVPVYILHNNTTLVLS